MEEEDYELGGGAYIVRKLMSFEAFWLPRKVKFGTIEKNPDNLSFGCVKMADVLPCLWWTADSTFF